ncbi:MAG: glycosyltransferase family 1 protein [Balneolales bacterium]
MDTTSVCDGKCGTGVYTNGLIRGLSSLDAVTRIRALGGRRDLLACPSGDKLQHVPVPHGNWHKLIQRDLFANAHNLSADVALFPNYFAPSGQPFPVLTTIHDLSFITHPQYYSRRMVAWYRYFVRKSVERSDRILTISCTSSLDIEQHLHVPPSRIHVIRPGISLPDPDRVPPTFHSWQKPDQSGTGQGPGQGFYSGRRDRLKQELDSMIKRNGNGWENGNGRRNGNGVSHHSSLPYYLYIGNIEPKKNILAMVEGFLASGVEGRLVIAGKITHTKLGKKFLRIIQSNDRIRYIAYPDDLTLARLLKNAAGHVNLSHIEGFGLPLLEAFRFEVPSLISLDPAMAETAEEQAVQVPANNPDAIASGFVSLSKFSRDAGFYHHCRKIRSLHTWDQFAESLEPLLETGPTPPDGILLYNWPSSCEQTEENIPHLKNGISDLAQCIIHTLAYSAVYRMPMDKNALYHGLIEKKCTRDAFDKAWSNLLDQYPDLFFEKYGSCGMAGLCRSPLEIRQKQRQNTDFLYRNSGLLRLLSRFPFCAGLFLSGGVVHGTHLSEKDIDLFVVAERNRVWVLYTLYRLFALLTRRSAKICTNYLVDRSAMRIRWQRDFYTAHQLAHLYPANASSSGIRPLSYNQWIYEIFPNMRDDQYGEWTEEEDGNAANHNAAGTHHDEGVQELSGIQGDKKQKGLLSLVNLILMIFWTRKWRWKGLRNRQGGMLWDMHRIKLHSNDHRPGVYHKWEKIINDIESKISKKHYEYSDREPDRV